MLKQLLFALLGLTHLAEADQVWHENDNSYAFGKSPVASSFSYTVNILDSYIEEDENGVPHLW